MSEHTSSTSQPTRTRRSRSAAQAMVEFGLALPILLMVMYGLIETGRLVFMYASVVSAARQAVRYGSVTGENATGTKYYNDCAGIRGAAKKLGFLQPIQDSDIQISYDTGPGGSTLAASCPVNAAGHPVPGDRIRVQVSMDYSPIVPLVPFDDFPITSSGTRTLLVGVSVAVDVPGVILTPGGTGAMTLFKDSNTPNFDHPGQIILYTYTLTNLGSAPITGINMTDDKADLVDCSGATDPLAGGASTSCTASYVVTEGDVAAGSLTNTATATATSGGVPLVAHATLTIGFIPLPEITLVKEGHPPVVIEPGELATYTFTLQNTGNVPLNSPYTISDPLIGGNWSCAGAASPLDMGASTACTGTYAIKVPDIDNRQVTNTASATGLYGTFTVTSNPSTTTVFIPELVVTLTASPPNVTALGQTITYTYTLENRTSKAMSNLIVTDTRGANKFPCLGSLAPAASASCTRSYTAYTQADMDAGFIINQATADAQGNVHSSSSSVTVVVTQNPQLTLEKTTSVTQALTIGAPITYSYTLRNTGNVTLSGPYAVTDNKIPSINCSGATGTMAPNATKSCANVTYNVTANDIASGSIVNRATATAKYGAVTVTSAEASRTVITFAGARLGLVKSSTPGYFTTSGQVLNYTFTLKNTGGLAINGPFSVTDDKMPSVNCGAATSPIPVGGSTTCTGSYTVSLADNIATFVTNTATATANGGALSSTPSPTVFTVNKFVCTSSRLKHAPPTPIQDAQNAVWTVINNTGIPVTIASATISWTGGTTTLNQVLLGGTSIWNGPPSSSSGGFTLPGAPWTLPNGNTVMQLNFSGVTSGIRVVLTFSEAGCPPTVDSNVIYPD
jgi:hypothetical protein